MNWDKLKSPKTWAPLVASAGIGYAAYTGVEFGAAEQAEVVDGITNAWGYLQELLGLAAAALGGLGLWNASKK